MLFFKTLPIRLCLFSLPLSAIFAAPVNEIDNELMARYDENGVVKLLERAPGDTARNPIDVTFDISSWPDIAEENCFVMLCLMNGNRVL